MDGGKKWRSDHHREGRNKKQWHERTFEGDGPGACGLITKTVLATGILHLATIGKVNIDDPIIKYLPTVRFSNPWEATSSPAPSLKPTLVAVNCEYFICNIICQSPMNVVPPIVRWVILELTEVVSEHFRRKFGVLLEKPDKIGNIFIAEMKGYVLNWIWSS